MLIQLMLILLFYFVTILGSSLSSIAAFLSIEGYFHGLIFIGIALSARTFASAFFSYFANYIVHKLGIRKCFIISQVFGGASLIILMAGFYFNQFIVTLLGIILTGLPATFVAILLTITLKVSIQDNKEFRNASGKRELILGSALLLSSILAPVLLYKYNLNFVLLLDLLSYVFGLMMTLMIQFPTTLAVDDNEIVIPLSKLVFLSQDAQSFMLKASASLLLAGFIPLLASSSMIDLTAKMPVLLREWFWVIEDITAILASSFYIILISQNKKTWFEPFLMLNSIWFILPFININNYMLVIITIIIVCLLIDFSFKKFRDDLVISAGSDYNLIQAYSALSQLLRNSILFLSPIILSLLLYYTNLITCMLVSFSIQAFLFAVIVLLRNMKQRSYEQKFDNV